MAEEVGRWRNEGKGRAPRTPGLGFKSYGAKPCFLLSAKTPKKDYGSTIWCILILRGYAHVYLIGSDILISPVLLQLHRMTYQFEPTILQEKQTWLSLIQSFSSTSPLPVSFFARKVKEIRDLSLSFRNSKNPRSAVSAVVVLHGYWRHVSLKKHPILMRSCVLHFFRWKCVS